MQKGREDEDRLVCGGSRRAAAGDRKQQTEEEEGAVGWSLDRKPPRVEEGTATLVLNLPASLINITFPRSKEKRRRLCLAAWQPSCTGSFVHTYKT